MKSYIRLEELADRLGITLQALEWIIKEGEIDLDFKYLGDTSCPLIDLESVEKDADDLYFWTYMYDLHFKRILTDN